MPVIVSVNEIKGFPTTSINESLTGTVTSIYSGFDIEYDIEFRYVESDNSETPSFIEGSVTNVNFLTDITELGLTATILTTSTYKISGQVNTVFGGEKFTFVMKDKTVKELPYPNNEDWFALVKYEKPTNTEEQLLSYGVDVEWSINNFSLTNTGTEIFTVTQYVYWSVDSAVSLIKNIVQSGG